MGSSSNNQKKNFELLDSTYFAAKDGDITKFKQHGQRVDQILTPNDNTILHIYITARRRRVSKQERKTDDFVSGILEMCPDLLWQTNKKGETLLHMAARHGHADVAKLLLDECNKSWQNHDQERGIKATRRMLQMASNEAKDTALHEAVRYNCLDVVEILTKEDPSLPYEANTAGETPLYLAAERRHARVLEAILDTCDSPADGGPCDRTALHMAVFHNDEEMTTLLLDKKGICKSKQDQQGWTPLHFAAHVGHVVILKKLLEVDKYAAYMGDKEGKTALHVAAAGGKVKIMKELLSTCPGCCELVDNRGWNVLHFALTSESNGAIRLVLQNRCLRNLINEKDENGNTPFLQAAYMGLIRHFLSVPILADPLEPDQVDRLVFNHHNYNAADIISANKSRLLSNDLSLTLWCLENFKVSPGMRTRISEYDNGESKSQKGKVNPKSSESGDDKHIVNEANKQVEYNLLGATLIATVSFAAGITIPGGFITDKGPHQGTAILTGKGAFTIFVALNSMSLCLSSLAVFFHLYGSNISSNMVKHMLAPLLGRDITTWALMTMMGAFLSGTWAVLRHPDNYLATETTILAVLVLFPVLAVCYNFEFIAVTLVKKLREIFEFIAVTLVKKLLYWLCSC